MLTANEYLFSACKKMGKSLGEMQDIFTHIVSSELSQVYNPLDESQAKYCYDYLLTQGLITHTSLIDQISVKENFTFSKMVINDNPDLNIVKSVIIQDTIETKTGEIYHNTRHNNRDHSLQETITNRTTKKGRSKSINLHKNNNIKNSSVTDVNETHIIHSLNEYEYNIGRSQYLIFKVGGVVYYRNKKTGRFIYVTEFISYNPYIYVPIKHDKFSIDEFLLIQNNLTGVCNYNRVLKGKNNVKGQENIGMENKKIEDLIYFLLMTGIGDKNKDKMIHKKVELYLITATKNNLKHKLRDASKLGIDTKGININKYCENGENKDKLIEVLIKLERR